jgi:hypothetical protein
MNVAEFLSDLKNDELSDMFIGNRNNEIECRSKLLPIMNRAMLQAYAKYMIAWDSLQLTVTADEDTYDLMDDTVTDPDLTEEPLAVTEVINSYGRALDPDEVRIQGSILYFPCPQDVELQVVYKTKPVRFTEAQDDEDTEIVLPEMLLPWMSSWVAARYFLGQTDEAKRAKGAELLSLASTFENAFTGTNTTNEFTREDTSKLCARGFA